MLIGQRLRQLREERNLSQGDIEKSTGLLRCYISRVEHGHTVPSLETLERFAFALDVPIYRLFRTEEAAVLPHQAPGASLEEVANQVGPAGTEARLLLELKGLVEKMTESERSLLLDFARKLAARSGGL